jgi:hypothetical protein
MSVMAESSEPQTLNCELHFDVTVAGSRESMTVSFAHEDGEYGLRAQIGIHSYSIRASERTCITMPGQPQVSVTVITGVYENTAGRGSILIVVNCGHQPPSLQIAMLPSAGVTQAWSCEITHEIQHQILEFLPT